MMSKILTVLFVAVAFIALGLIYLNRIRRISSDTLYDLAGSLSFGNILITLLMFLVASLFIFRNK